MRADGRPHVVVCCYAVAGDRVWTAIDAKPKSGAPLQRLANVRAHPHASLLVDHYEEDWDALWWVRVDGAAQVLENEERAIAALRAKYEQYETARPGGPLIAVAIERISGWGAV